MLKFAWRRPIRTLSLDAKNAKEDAKVARKALYSSASFASFFATLASEKTLPEAVPFEEWMLGAEPFEPFLWTQRTQREDAKVARKALYSFASFASLFATLASEKTLPEAVPLEEWIPAFTGMTSTRAIT